MPLISCARCVKPFAFVVYRGPRSAVRVSLSSLRCARCSANCHVNKLCCAYYVIRVALCTINCLRYVTINALNALRFDKCVLRVKILQNALRVLRIVQNLFHVAIRRMLRMCKLRKMRYERYVYALLVLRCVRCDTHVALRIMRFVQVVKFNSDCLFLYYSCI